MGIACGALLSSSFLSHLRGEKKIGTSLGWDGGEGGGGNHHHVKSEKKGGGKARRQQHSLQQLSFPFLGRSEEAKEEEVSIDGGERRERGRGFLPPLLGWLLAALVRLLPRPNCGGRRFWAGSGERGGGGGEEQTLLSSKSRWAGRGEKRRGGLLYAPVGLAGYIGKEEEEEGR